MTETTMVDNAAVLITDENDFYETCKRFPSAEEMYRQQRSGESCPSSVVGLARQGRGNL